jgi:hypothetical protein
MTTDDNSTGDDNSGVDTVTQHPDQETTSGQGDAPETMPEHMEKPRRRRGAGFREAAHQHPVWMPIGTGVAGLVVGAGVTAALFAAGVPPTAAPPAAGAAQRETPHPPPPPPPPRCRGSAANLDWAASAA